MDVGGYRLHLNCVGQGSPTVILESGLGNMSTDWANVRPEVAKTTRVCAYDRAGTGWSEPGTAPRDPQQIARELHTLLSNAGIDDPYVLAGQSFGGLYVRIFAARYPTEVAGIVLVDASHPDMWTRLPPEVVGDSKPPTWQVMAMTLLTRLGALRITAAIWQGAGCRRGNVRKWKHIFASTRYRVTWGQEMLAPDRDAQVRATGGLGDRPLAVLTAGDHGRDFGAGVSGTARAGFERAWQDLQNELAELSTNSTNLVVAGAGHSTLQTDHEDAQVTSAAIDKVVKAVRTDQPLTR